MTQRTGQSVQNFQQFAATATRLGVNASSVVSDVSNLIFKASSALPGQFNQGLFLLGVNASKARTNYMGFIKDLSGSLSRLNPVRAMQLGQMAGLSPDTVQMLRDQRFSRYLSSPSPFQLNQNQVATLKDFNVQMSTLSFTLRSFGRSTVAQFADSYFKSILGVNRELTQADRDKAIDHLNDSFKGMLTTLTPLTQMLMDIGSMVGGSILSVISDVSQVLHALPPGFTKLLEMLISFSIIIRMVGFLFSPLLKIFTRFGGVLALGTFRPMLARLGKGMAPLIAGTLGELFKTVFQIGTKRFTNLLQGGYIKLLTSRFGNIFNKILPGNGDFPILGRLGGAFFTLEQIMFQLLNTVMKLGLILGLVDEAISVFQHGLDPKFNFAGTIATAFEDIGKAIENGIANWWTNIKNGFKALFSGNFSPSNVPQTAPPSQGGTNLRTPLDAMPRTPAGDAAIRGFISRGFSWIGTGLMNGIGNANGNWQFTQNNQFMIPDQGSPRANMNYANAMAAQATVNAGQGAQ
jgi:hypothetical protein